MEKMDHRTASFLSYGFTLYILRIEGKYVSLVVPKTST
jgi:hypothetical protein